MAYKTQVHHIIGLPPFAAGHGAMSFPKPRNSYDGQLEPWSNWAYPCDKNHEGENCTITGVVGLNPKHYAEIGKEVHCFDCNWLFTLYNPTIRKSQYRIFYGNLNISQRLVMPMPKLLSFFYKVVPAPSPPTKWVRPTH